MRPAKLQHARDQLCDLAASGWVGPAILALEKGLLSRGYRSIEM